MRYYYMTNMTPDGTPSKHGIGFRFKPEKDAAYEMTDHLKVIIQEAGLGEKKPFKEGDPPKRTIVVLGYDITAQEPFQLELSFGLHGKETSPFLPELLEALNATETKASVLQLVKDGKFYVCRVTKSVAVTKQEVIDAAFNAHEVVSKKLQYLDPELPEPKEPEVVADVELDV